MFEAWIGWIGWPVALVVSVLIVCITVYEINDANHKDDVRKACIVTHGTLGEHNGWPTCTPAR